MIRVPHVCYPKEMQLFWAPNMDLANEFNEAGATYCLQWLGRRI